MTAQVAAEPHRVEWRIDNARDPYATFTCSAPEGANCRSYCTESACEEVCPVRDEDGRLHRWGPIDYCRIVTWLENSGTPGELYMGEDDEPVRSGPIETEWSGDGYLWQYAAAAEAGQ